MITMRSQVSQNLACMIWQFQMLRFRVVSKHLVMVCAYVCHMSLLRLGNIGANERYSEEIGENMEDFASQVKRASTFNKG